MKWKQIEIFRSDEILIYSVESQYPCALPGNVDQYFIGEDTILRLECTLPTEEGLDVIVFFDDIYVAFLWIMRFKPLKINDAQYAHVEELNELKRNGSFD